MQLWTRMLAESRVSCLSIDAPDRKTNMVSERERFLAVVDGAGGEQLSLFDEPHVQAAGVVLRVWERGQHQLAQHLVVESTKYFELIDRPDQLKAFYRLIIEGINRRAGGGTKKK